MVKTTSLATGNQPVKIASSRLSVRAAAEMAGVSEGTIRRWIALGLFPSSRPIPSGSGRRFVDRAAFERFLAGGA